MLQSNLRPGPRPHVRNDAEETSCRNTRLREQGLAVLSLPAILPMHRELRERIDEVTALSLPPPLSLS